MTTQEPDSGVVPDAEVALLPWDEIYNKAFLSSHIRPSLWDAQNPMAMSEINSVLSAASYPFPESYGPSRQQGAGPLQLYGGILLENPPHERPLSSESLSKPNHKQLDRSEKASDSTKAASKKRGRPRKTAPTPQGENPDERRRMQIRLAQRAYRSRKEANISSLKNRVSLLETALEKMSSSVLSLSEELVQSGVLQTHPDITGPLRDTVQTCLSLAKEATADGTDHETLETSPKSEESFSSSSAPDATQLPTPQPTESTSTFIPEASASWDLIETNWQGEPVELSPDMSDMEVSAFIERLHFACLYQGHLALADPSIPITRLEAPFRLLLTRMDRQRIRSYFEAALYARASQKRLEEWKDIPFFCLGGAGTHYPQSSSLQPSATSSRHPYQRWTMVHDPLAPFSSKIKEQLDGDWFDIKDLEGYLLEKRVHLRASPPVSKRRSPAQAVVNVARLLPALINKAVCLGRTPGFRRRDVDKALVSAVWT